SVENSRYSSERGSGIVGLKGQAGVSAGEDAVYDIAGMYFPNGFDDLYFSPTFLVYNNGTKKVMMDGYVGSDGYTSVWCLGICNSWGNVWTWIFGSAVVHDESENFAYIFVNFDYYDSSVGNYYTSSMSSSFEDQSEFLLSKKYSRLTYGVPNDNGVRNHLGVSAVNSGNGLMSFVGLPTQSSNKCVDYTQGLTDSYWVLVREDVTFGISRGGGSHDLGNAGAFCYTVNSSLNNANLHYGFRTMLIP
ncbi:MAG: hypothetical protein IKC79_02390, partial [Clostridia bacterium]|nr:hypothetical protein [Clostridia bacterium]